MNNLKILSTMRILDPDVLDIVLSFSYRGWILELDRGEFEGQTTFAVWAKNEQGCAVAVPCSFSRRDAIQRAKKWVDQQRQIRS